MRVLALSVVAAAGLSASVTAAAELKVGAEKTASQSNPWDVAFGVEFMTDYNWRGITVSARRPSVEAYVEPRYRPAADLELYAGVSGANVDLPNGSRAQIVYYAGTRPTFGPLLLDLGGWYIDYPGGATFTGIGSADTCTNGAFLFRPVQHDQGRRELLRGLCESRAHHQRDAGGWRQPLLRAQLVQ
jgi:Bacterial protein of unknown function (Gcw_chp)